MREKIELSIKGKNFELRGKSLTFVGNLWIKNWKYSYQEKRVIMMEYFFMKHEKRVRKREWSSMPCQQKILVKAIGFHVNEAFKKFSERTFS